jgi:serine/threonine-protein kinase
LYPQIFGKYVLERELARGGMARVLLATLRGAGGFEKRLVVKQIRDELAFDHQFVRRFVEEAKTTVALSHPNIVPVYELGVEQGTYFLAMELVEGASVAELLRERDVDGGRRVLTPEEGAHVGIEVCRALDYAHRRMRVVHRDITPRNVMIDEEGQIKLIDFGIAAPALVSGQEILGSPGHMAPEQVDGGELGAPTDIFAVAVLLMEAWTGTPPFRRGTPEECAAAMRGPRPRPGDFDPRLAPLDDAILRAMSADPRDRQQEASELGRALRAFLQGLDPIDLARGLGDRVRDLRERASLPTSPPSAAAPRPSAASHGDLGTKTFAAREEALTWSSPPPAAEPATGVSASTRRLADTPPDAFAAPASRPASRREADPAMAIPTPLMVEVEELERVHEQISASRAAPAGGAIASSPPRQRDVPTERRRRGPPLDAYPADKLETSAMRPIETPVRELATTRPRSARSSLAIGALGAAMLVGAGLLAWRSGRGPATAHGRAAAEAAPEPSASEAPAPNVAPSVVVAPSPPATGHPAPAPSASAPATGKVPVTFLGSPGTRVSVDGVWRGACPQRLTLTVGGHDVRFLFEPTGESRGERFTLRAGERLTVQADFTGATPTVRYQR